MREMADSLELTTEWGTIQISKNAVGSILDRAMAPLEDRAWIAGRRGMLGSLADAVGMGDDYAELMMDVDADGRLTLSMDIIVRFGISIKAVTDGIIDTLRKGVTQLTGQPPRTIRIHVVGTLSKQLIRRDIEVVWNDEG